MDNKTYKTIVLSNREKISLEFLSNINSKIRDIIEEYTHVMMDIEYIFTKQVKYNIENPSEYIITVGSSLPNEIYSANIFILLDENDKPHIIKNYFEKYNITPDDLKDPLKLLKFHYMMWDEIVNKNCTKEETNIYKYIDRKYLVNDEYKNLKIESTIQEFKFTHCFLCLYQELIKYEYESKCKSCCLTLKYGGNCNTYNSLWSNYISTKLNRDNETSKECAIKIRDVVIPEIIKRI